MKRRTTATPDPVISNITATGFDVPGSPITVRPDVTHASGVELVPLNIEGVYRHSRLKPATRNRWSQTFDRIPYVLVGTAVDVTAPTGRMTKPMMNTTLPNALGLEAFTVDSGSGMRGV